MQETDMRNQPKLTRWSKRIFRHARVIVIALVTPLLEKNPMKTATFSFYYVPMVLSMARVIVLLFALRMLDQVKRGGVSGWPEATLCIAIVLALPLLNALERVSARGTIEVANSLLGAIGRRAAPRVAGAHPAEPGEVDGQREEESPMLERAA
jgi:hypothetical protein